MCFDIRKAIGRQSPFLTCVVFRVSKLAKTHSEFRRVNRSNRWKQYGYRALVQSVSIPKAGNSRNVKKNVQKRVIRIICIAVRWLLYPRKKSNFVKKVVGDGAECNWDRVVDALLFVRSLDDDSCRLLKQVVILFLEAANFIHVNGLELALGLLLIGGKLLFSYRFEANSGIVADSDNENATALALAVIVVLVRKGDVNFRYIIGRVGRRVGVLQHRLAIAANDDDAGATVVFGLNGKAVLEHGLLAGFVVGRQRFVAKLLHATGAAEEVEGGDEDDGDKGEDEDGDDGVDHPIGAIFRA